MKKGTIEDVELMQKAINNGLFSASKELVNKIEQRFENIESFMLNYLDKVDDVKVIMIKQPF